MDYNDDFAVIYIFYKPNIKWHDQFFSPKIPTKLYIYRVSISVQHIWKFMKRAYTNTTVETTITKTEMENANSYFNEWNKSPRFVYTFRDNQSIMVSYWKKKLGEFLGPKKANFSNQMCHNLFRLIEFTVLRFLNTISFFRLLNHSGDERSCRRMKTFYWKHVLRIKCSRLSFGDWQTFSIFPSASKTGPQGRRHTTNTLFVLFFSFF